MTYVVSPIPKAQFRIWKLNFWPYGQLGAVLEKMWADYEQLLRAVFHVFIGKKIFYFFGNIVAFAIKSCIK